MIQEYLFRRWSNSLLIASLALTGLGWCGAYGMHQPASISGQVVAHLILLLGPSLGKIGYVLRLAAEDSARSDSMSQTSEPISAH